MYHTLDISKTLTLVLFDMKSHVFIKPPIHRGPPFFSLSCFMWITHYKWPFRADWARQIFSNFSLLSIFFFSIFFIFIFSYSLFCWILPIRSWFLAMMAGVWRKLSSLSDEIVSFVGISIRLKEIRCREFAIFAYCLYVILTAKGEKEIFEK